jgi:hypothetical protein
VEHTQRLRFAHAPIASSTETRPIVIWTIQELQTRSSHRLAASALAAVLSTVIAALVLASGVAAATPCSEAILADWLDNSRIDHVYELTCYEAAIDAIPGDLRDYTDAAEVIARAFQSASGRQLETRTPQGRRSEDLPTAVVPTVNASSPSSVPVPLLVLGSLALALLAAGGLGYVARNRQEPGADDDR